MSTLAHHVSLRVARDLPGEVNGTAGSSNVNIIGGREQPLRWIRSIGNVMPSRR